MSNCSFAETTFTCTNGKIMGRIIGTGGSGTKRITNTTRSQFKDSSPYLRGDRATNTIRLTARGNNAHQAVRFMEQMVLNEQNWATGKTTICPHPHCYVPVDNLNYVRHVIGRGGSGLRNLCSRVGKGVFIVHKPDLSSYLIEATTERDVIAAKTLLLERIHHITVEQAPSHTTSEEQRLTNKVCVSSSRTFDTSPIDSVIHIKDTPILPRELARDLARQLHADPTAWTVSTKDDVEDEHNDEPHTSLHTLSHRLARDLARQLHADPTAWTGPPKDHPQDNNKDTTHPSLHTVSRQLAFDLARQLHTNPKEMTVYREGHVEDTPHPSIPTVSHQLAHDLARELHADHKAWTISEEDGDTPQDTIIDSPWPKVDTFRNWASDDEEDD